MTPRERTRWSRKRRAGYPRPRRLRGENTRLQDKLIEMEEKLRSAAPAPQLPSGELERLRAGQTELLKLRGEIGRLQQELRETARQKPNQSQSLAAATESAKSSMVAFGMELQDMGAVTPERAASSLIWAATAGQRARVAELLELPEGVTEADAPKHFDFFTQQLSNVFSRMEFTSIEGIKPNSDGTLKLNFVYRNPSTGKTGLFPFMLRLRDSVWKVVVEGKPKDL